MAEQEGEPGKAPQSNKPPAAKEEAPETDGLPTAVEPALVPVLQIMEETGVPEEAQVSIIAAIRESYSGPLPPPAMLKAYGEACPGGAEIILKAFQEENAHRRSIEQQRMDLQRDAVTANIDYVKTDQSLAGRGQYIAAILAVLFGISAWSLGMHGHDWLAGVLSTTTIGAVFASFAIGRKNRNQDNKDDDNTDEVVDE